MFKFINIFYKILDFLTQIVYYNTCKEVIPLRDKIKEMTEIIKELNKLFDQLIKLSWKISSLAGVILFIIYSLTK